MAARKDRQGNARGTLVHGDRKRRQKRQLPEINDEDLIMETKTLKYQPKGSMCTACRHQKKDCSNLPFDKMVPMLKRSDDTVIVYCTHFFEREKQ